MKPHNIILDYCEIDNLNDLCIFNINLILNHPVFSNCNSIQDILKPKGVAVYIYAEHFCIKCRGVHKENVSMITSHFTGIFKKNIDYQKRFLDYLDK